MSEMLVSGCLPWQDIDWVLLDMDGTLLDLYFDNYFWLEHVPQQYAEQNNISLESARKELFKSFDQKRGQIEWYCLDYWTQALELPIASLKQDIQHKIALRHQAEDFLQELTQMGKHIVLVTNAHPESLRIKMERTELKPWFNNIISTHEYGMPKEQQACWVALEQAIGFDKQRTIFIDDSQAVLEAAQLFGIRWCLGIKNPDSKGFSKHAEGFPLIGNFMDLFSNDDVKNHEA
jgi:5'-nucleotidase